MKGIFESLKSNDRRITKTRKSIVDVLIQNCSLTVEEISQKCSIRSLSTVYRNLQVLREEGHVTSKVTQGSKTHYELTNKKRHHHHLTCITCGTTKVVTLPNEDFIKKQFVKYKFQPVAHIIELEGRCRKCA